MESLQSIKSRLRAVRNIGKITKAMEVVAATKMRKSQEVALSSRGYSWESLKLLNKLIAHSSQVMPLAERRNVASTLVVLISSDRGMAGAFNTQVFKAVERFVKENTTEKTNGQEFKFLAIGKKSINYCKKNGIVPIHFLTGVGDIVNVSLVGGLSDLITQGFLEKKWDRVITISMHFRTTLVQEVLIREVLPLSTDSITNSIIEIVPEYGRYSSEEKLSLKEALGSDVEYIFEPDREIILNNLVPHLIKMELYHLLLEANASEHSARRVAMKSASDNASDVAETLGRQYNKLRQSGITKELIEITSTQSALQ